MYDELVKRLRKKAEAFDYDGWVETASDLEKAADAIEELLAERDENYAGSWKTAFEVERDEHRWIPVTERLPEKDVRVIVCASLPEGVHSDFIYEDGHWFVSTGVTHWMSLPEPPEEESNGV